MCQYKLLEKVCNSFFFEGVPSLGVTGLVILLENFSPTEGKVIKGTKNFSIDNSSASVHQGVQWPPEINQED